MLLHQKVETMLDNKWILYIYIEAKELILIIFYPIEIVYIENLIQTMFIYSLIRYEEEKKTGKIYKRNFK